MEIALNTGFRGGHLLILPSFIMKLREITSFLESRAPLSLQENYDNAGLILGHSEMEVTGALVCLDSTEEVVDEAISLGFNLIIAHHPIVFSGIKKLNGNNYVERVIIKAIKANIAIYAIHTNLDNVQVGVNKMLCEKIGLTECRILQPKAGTLNKLSVYVPLQSVELVRKEMFAAGAGNIGIYNECSFSMQGNGTFRASEGARPYVGEIGVCHVEPEEKLEVVVPVWLTSRVISAMKKAHPYEEVAYDLVTLGNHLEGVGAGMYGQLQGPLSPIGFLKQLKIQLDVTMIKHTSLCKSEIRTVAVCGGSGSFLLPAAIGVGADVYVTSDFRYHQFFDADQRIIVADVGHYESEVGVKELLIHWLAEKFPTFATRSTSVVTNPVNYL